MKTIHIRFGSVTLVGYLSKKFPIKGGNCFSLIDTDGESHRVVNFGYENLVEWMKRTGQKDIKVRCIPKSDWLWEICDERIPKEWYNVKYCTTCTPLRLLPFEQRKEYVKGSTFKKVYNEDGTWYLIMSTKIIPNARKLNFKWTTKQDQNLVYASYIPVIKKD